MDEQDRQLLAHKIITKNDCDDDRPTSSIQLRDNFSSDVDPPSSLLIAPAAPIITDADVDDHENQLEDSGLQYFNSELIAHVFSAAVFRKKLTWCKKIHHILHSALAQTIIVVFVILDALVVFAQLYVDLQSEKEKFAQLELIYKHNKTEEAHDKQHIIEMYHVAYESLHYTSMFLLTLFFVEVTTKMITGWHHFITSAIEVLDAGIVIISWSLDILLLFEEVSLMIEGIAQLLILLRLWRIARIVNGAAVAMDSKWRAKYKALEDRLKELEKERHPSQRTSDSSDYVSNRHESIILKREGLKNSVIVHEK